MKVFKNVVIFIGVLFAIFLSYLGGVILFAAIFDYKPENVENVKICEKATGVLNKNTLTIFDWNIGYAGLGKDMDFFLDGGKNAIVPSKLVGEYLNGILEVLREKRADIYLFQEIDVKSWRTHYVNQLEFLKQIGDYDIAFAYNYKVLFVPVPYLNPMGKVEAGLATFSKYKIDEAKRYSLPGEYSWPTKLFQLDRCLLLTRIRTLNNKELVLLNIHPSAYDKGGVLREKQLKFIMKLAKNEYEKGNYVVIGGDWNSEFYSEKLFGYTEEKPEAYIKLPELFKLNGWKWGISKNAPTNRSISAPYVKGETFVTVIDGFYVSPNIEILEVENLDLGFEYSDHNPVVMKIMLK
ncbi:endonuclease [Thermosipho melanesiensis]|uniref:Endonuclease/exonuclease/phosphatase n=2 Tax=Thermosipho melanesiensis TaxID=46541 RepID=A6LNI0_THEM4|nr:endonuclease/exonuclease/phosphatase family protein [Thermosipho melanesiensis]ABR31481.1 Endonuclease/exonuclease/phosphatase [Thermosipho melanesiensis BI429]APT74539.1 endonuclease [Thermosipho melanesiensis]OOC36490.1 endonuclease [Thermosipho melanesiensis]OOC37308.1 endonuclease [Thermosipho melanesiensis]OOC38061.1 endonuclease [Thermosipho melanesiensis]